MAFGAGNIAEFYIDSTANGTLTRISVYVSKVSMNPERKDMELARLGGTSVARLVGPPKTAIAMEGWYDPTIDAIFGTAINEGTAVPRHYRYFEQGSATGLFYYSGSAFVTKYSVDTGAEDPATWKADLAVDGANTQTTI